MILEVSDVWKKFRKNWILKGVNLGIEHPSLLAIVGKNGSGKTTLLKIMCGLVRPTKGTVRVFGENLNTGSYSKIGVLLHENVLYDELTVRENLEFYDRMFGFMGDVAKDAFDRLGLDEFSDKRVKTLSYGWKKRLNFVRALINDPEILLLDEPLSGLDVVEIMFELSKERVVIFTSPSELDFCKTFKLVDGVLI
jgi:ABC-type multidrug transport system ATPase subunit